MKIDQLSIQGFRGINEKLTIAFHPHLTIIYGPNSYGKTSISEALEWQIYGTTSRLDNADSKEEYHGSLRNLHLTEAQAIEVEAHFSDGDIQHSYRSIQANNESIQRFVDDQPVESWPIQINSPARPFILQHTLKDLLLAKPSERFKEVAGLLGFNILEQIQNDIISFCTGPNAHIPSRVQDLQRSIAAIESRLQSLPNLKHIAKAYKKGFSNWEKTTGLIYKHARKYISSDVTDEEILPQLQRRRQEAINHFFPGHLDLHAYTESECTQIRSENQYFLKYITEDFVNSYTKLIGIEACQTLNEHIQFFNLGIHFLNETEDSCPFCGQFITNEQSQLIQATSDQLHGQQNTYQTLMEQRTNIMNKLQSLHFRLKTIQNNCITRIYPIISLTNDEKSLNALKTILKEKYYLHINTILKSTAALEEVHNNLLSAFNDVNTSIELVTSSLKGERHVESILMTNLGKALIKYVAAIENVLCIVNEHAQSVNLVSQILQSELDKRAGTEDISVLIDLLRNNSKIAKKLEIDAILSDLKKFRSSVKDFVSTEIDNTVTQTFTSDVLTWYNKIRTTTDPDIHFEGFELKHTSRGTTKERRICINATSYGEKLVSAVSSLSESKLNMLGICIRIATNQYYSQPFQFLIIDDPIQSLDTEHEAQFVEIIRELVDQGKQVILLSHNKPWVETVRDGCRSKNGYMYEITGYNVTGPIISEKSWVTTQDRLKEISAIIQNTQADNIQLQQAEEEVRIVVCDLTSQLAKKVLGTCMSPDKLNARQVRTYLIECNVEQHLIDCIGQTFSTTDSSHHIPANYAPSRERVARYLQYLHKLEKVVRNTEPKATSTQPISLSSRKQQAPPIRADVDMTPNTIGNTVTHLHAGDR